MCEGVSKEKESSEEEEEGKDEGRFFVPRQIFGSTAAGLAWSGLVWWKGLQSTHDELVVVES